MSSFVCRQERGGGGSIDIFGRQNSHTFPVLLPLCLLFAIVPSLAVGDGGKGSQEKGVLPAIQAGEEIELFDNGLYE